MFRFGVFYLKMNLCVLLSKVNQLKYRNVIIQCCKCLKTVVYFFVLGLYLLRFFFFIMQLSYIFIKWNSCRDILFDLFCLISSLVDLSLLTTFNYCIFMDKPNKNLEEIAI